MRSCVIVVLLVLLFLPGCPWFVDPYVEIEPQVPVVKKTVVVVPFSDAENTYFSSEDGNVLARLVVREIRKREPGAKIVDIDQLRAMYSGEELESVGWSAVGQSVRADYVLVGNIESFTLTDTGNANLYRSTLRLRLKVIETTNGTVVWSASHPDATYRWPQVAVPVFDSTPEEFRAGALADAAQRVGNVFCRQTLSRADYARRTRTRKNAFPE